MLKKEKIYILLSTSGLRLYSRRPELNAGYDFTAGELNHQEVTDLNKYNLLLLLIINKLPNADLILLIADEFIYRKNIYASTRDKFLEEKVSFLSLTPFDEAKIAHTSVQLNGWIEVIAVNRDLFEPILAVTNQEKKKIKHIVPISLLHKDNDATLTYDRLEKNYSQNLFKKYDLLSAQYGIPDLGKTNSDLYTDNREKVNRLKIRLIAEFSLLLILLGVLFSILFQQKKAEKIIVLNNISTRAPIPTSTVTSTPQPTIFYKPLNSLKIQILNGSRLAGQAAKLKGALTEMGLTEIEAGNHETNDNTDISLAVSNNVSPDDEMSLLKQVESVFPDLTVIRTATKPANFDVMILIGNTPIK